MLARNAFTLALLDPAVVNRYSDVSKRNPFYQLSTTGVDVGGQTSGRNEVQIDGSPIGVGSGGSCSPPMDAVHPIDSGATPSRNAVSNAFTRAPNVVRNQLGGGTMVQRYKALGGGWQ